MPVWLQVLLAVVTPVIAMAGVAVAFQQRQLAHRNLKHALFDRRWAVYAATNDVLVTFINGNRGEQSQRLAEFLRRKMDAQFLFDEGLLHYLEEIQDAVNRYRSAFRALQSERPRSSDERSSDEAAVISGAETLRSLHKDLVGQFRSSLALDQI